MIRVNIRSSMSFIGVAILMVALSACAPSTKDAVEQQEPVRDTLPVYRVVAPFTAVDQRGAVFNAFCVTQRDEGMRLALRLLFFGQRVIAELDAVVGEDFLDVERVLRHGVFKEAGGGVHAFVVMQLQINVSGRPVDGDEQVELVLAKVDLGSVDMSPQGGSMDRNPVHRF
jgi:hypothetical protein